MAQRDSKSTTISKKEYKAHALLVILGQSLKRRNILILMQKSTTISKREYKAPALVLILGQSLEC